MGRRWASDVISPSRARDASWRPVMEWWRSRRKGLRQAGGRPGLVALREEALEEAPWSPFADGRDDEAGDDEMGEGAPRPALRARRARLVAIVGAVVLALLVVYLLITAPLSRSLQPIAAPQLTLLAADGTPIARNGALVDAPVDARLLPAHVIAPFLAIEDRRFYSHLGIDPRGIARAALTGVGGGSTITQQMAKFTFLSPEQTLSRKAREVLIAFWLEVWLTKDEILSRYLSNAYFGDNTYGLRAASLHYFYRQPENLRPEQAAMLAGLLQAPSRLAPTRNPDAAARRFALVRRALVDSGHLAAAEAAAMQVPELDVRTRNTLPTGTYFADWALPQARARGEPSYAAQTLATTLDQRLQAIARRVIARAPLGEAQVALVAMRPDGAVVAMIGGRDYAASPFNRATQARRQPGSTFKTILYLAALEQGWRPQDTIANTPLVSGPWRPANADGRYSRQITLANAFARSSNVAAVRLFRVVGDKAVIDLARRLGISARLPRGDPSLALGTSSVTLIELTAAYAGIAANAFPVTPRAFAPEPQGWLAWLWNRPYSLPGARHREIEQMLRTAINDGTGRAAMLAGPNYGKTGTSQDNRDALFVGYAGEGDRRLVVGVWIGHDDNRPLAGISGGGLPARIWRDFLREALARPRPAPAPARAASDPEGAARPQDLAPAEDPAPLPAASPGAAEPLAPFAPAPIFPTEPGPLAGPEPAPQPMVAGQAN